MSHKKESKKIQERKDFIRKWRTALKLKWSREQLSVYLGVKPDSLIRRRFSIKDTMGLNLPLLPSVPEHEDVVLNKTQVKAFETSLQELVDAEQTAQPVQYEQGKIRRYVITSAQNATPIHEKFWASILNYAQANKAMIMVIPYRYKNPTSVWQTQDKEHEYWDEKVTPYLVDKSMPLCKKLQVMAHIKIQPTASQPLVGFDSYTGMDSAIFGHPKVQLKTVPTPSQSLPKILSTTGAVTLSNYTDSKAGHVSTFHHSLAALIIETDNNSFHLRHIHADDETGQFYDLDKLYTPDKIIPNQRIAALVTGDTHAMFIDEQVEKATYFGEGSLVETLKPEVLVWHDVEDFYSRNHHHRGNDILSYGKHHFGRDNVEECLQITADFIDKCSRDSMLNVIVKSNHDEALDRWLREANPKEDPENARFFHYMKYNQYCNVRPTETGFETIDPFEFWCRNPDKQPGLRNKEQTVFLKRDQSFVVANIEVGFHGDRGPNGSYASLASFSKIGPKVIIGHSHSPGIFEGAYQVGVSARLDLEYVSGPSSWLHTHAIIYPDGHRTLISVIDGKWRF
jgi:hypothetical protein